MNYIRFYSWGSGDCRQRVMLCRNRPGILDQYISFIVVMYGYRKFMTSQSISGYYFWMMNQCLLGSCTPTYFLRSALSTMATKPHTSNLASKLATYIYPKQPCLTNLSTTIFTLSSVQALCYLSMPSQRYYTMILYTPTCLSYRNICQSCVELCWRRECCLYLFSVNQGYWMNWENIYENSDKVQARGALGWQSLVTYYWIYLVNVGIVYI